jgi:ribosomal protein S18 acetylase RimI-like enzyme
MLLTEAVEAEYGVVVELANLAYRGSGAERSWNTEAGIVEGTRLSESLLREDLASKPEARLLTYRAEPAGPLMGTVWLEPKGEGVWYLGLLTVRPEVQNRQMGRTLLKAAEDYVRERGGRRVRMRVVWVREALIEWYERRGYRLTGEREPFPYGDERFGRPLRDDLYFVEMEKELAAS